MSGAKPTWTDEDQARLVTLAGEGATGKEIGAAMGKSRNAILGRAFRTGVKLSFDAAKRERLKPMRKPRQPKAPRSPKEPRAPDYARFPADHPARVSRPWGTRAFSDDKITVAIAARLAGASRPKAARMIGAGPQILKRWERIPELASAAAALLQRAKADAAERARIARELAAVEAEATRLTVERVNWPILGRMPERHREICELRIAGKTLQEVGDRFGVTRERIRQIECVWRLRGLIVPGTRQLSEASRATFTRAERAPPKPKPARRAKPGRQPGKAKRPLILTEAERARRRQWAATLNARLHEART